MGVVIIDQATLNFTKLKYKKTKLENKYLFNVFNIFCSWTQIDS